MLISSSVNRRHRGTWEGTRGRGAVAPGFGVGGPPETFLPFIHRNEHSRLVSIFCHGNGRLYDQNTQIITEVDDKLNKWHIATEK